MRLILFFFGHLEKLRLNPQRGRSQGADRHRAQVLHQCGGSHPSSRTFRHTLHLSASDLPAEWGGYSKAPASEDIDTRIYPVDCQSGMAVEAFLRLRPSQNFHCFTVGARLPKLLKRRRRKTDQKQAHGLCRPGLLEQENDIFNNQ